MELSFSQGNIVVVATSFNPTLFRETWLVQQGLLTEGAIENYIYTPELVRIDSGGFSCVVVPNQMQVACGIREDAGRVLGAFVTRIVEKVPHTPFRAVGINITWSFPVERAQLGELTRRLFGGGPPALASRFTVADDAAFGLYMSRKLDGGIRLKAEFKPWARGDATHIDFSFNFHKDVGEGTAASDVVEAVRRWTEFDEVAESFSRATMGNALA